MKRKEENRLQKKVKILGTSVDDGFNYRFFNYIFITFKYWTVSPSLICIQNIPAGYGEREKFNSVLPVANGVNGRSWPKNLPEWDSKLASRDFALVKLKESWSWSEKGLGKAFNSFRPFIIGVVALGVQSLWTARKRSLLGPKWPCFVQYNR